MRSLRVCVRGGFRRTTMRLLLMELAPRRMGGELRAGGGCEGDALRALDGQPWDIIISDYSMPHFSGLAALQPRCGSGESICRLFCVRGRWGRRSRWRRDEGWGERLFVQGEPEAAGSGGGAGTAGGAGAPVQACDAAQELKKRERQLAEAAAVGRGLGSWHSGHGDAGAGAFG